MLSKTGQRKGGGWDLKYQGNGQHNPPLSPFICNHRHEAPPQA